MYEMAKHLHVTAVVVSVLLFSVRFALSIMEHQARNNKLLKVIPHIVDTILLGSAIWLVFLSPMTQVDGWIASKVIGVVLYIVSGFYALKWAKSKRSQILGFISAIVWITVTMGVAFSKQAFSFLA